MRLTKFQKELLARLAAGDKLYTDTRKGYGVVHRDDFNRTKWARVPFVTIRKLEGLGLIEIVGDFQKRGEYSIHWLGLTDAGRSRG